MQLHESRKLLVFVLCVGALVAVFNQTLLAPALPSMMDDLSVDPTTIQWLVSIFMLVSSVIVPANAYLLEKHTLKSLFLFSTVLFMIGSIIMAIGTNFAFVLAGRVLQAIGAGILTPMAIGAMMVIYPKEKRGHAQGIYGVITGFGPALGPAVSGFIVTWFGWRYVFVVVAALSFLCLLLGLIFIPRKKLYETNKRHLDKPSLFLCLTGFGLLLYGLNAIGSRNFECYVFIIGTIGLILSILFIYRQVKNKNAMLDFSLFKNKTFKVAFILLVVISSSGMCNAILLPILIQNVYEYSAAISGLVVVPGAILAIIINPFVGKYFDKHGARLLCILSCIFITITSFLLCSPQINLNIIYITVIWTFRNAALIVILRVLPTYGINSLKKQEVLHGNALFVSGRQIIGAFFTAIFISIFYLISIYAYPVIQATSNAWELSQLYGINIAFILQGIITLIATIYICFKFNNKKA